MEWIDDLLARTYAGNTVRGYVSAALIVLLAVLVSRLVRRRLGRLLKRLASFTRTTLDDRIAEGSVGPAAALVIVAGVHFASLVLKLPDSARQTLRSSLFVAAALTLTLLVMRAIDALFHEVVAPWASKTESKVDDQLVTFGRKLTKLVVAIVALAIILESVGFNVVSLVTGLGIGGLAVALAAQETLGNVLGTFQILTDQPFTVGDWIRIDGYFGKVVDVGLRSTKILTRGRILVVVPNKNVAGATIENVSVGGNLLVNLDLGLVYGTTADELQHATDIVNEILAGNPGVTADSLVHFLTFADFALVLKCTYFVSDIDRYWDVQHDVNMAVKRRFDEAGLDFAFPTQTIHMAREAGG